MNSEASTQFCPLCDGANHCALGAGGTIETCWCQGARIDPGALAAIPAAERGQRCLCPNCAAPKTTAHPAKGVTSER
ncbi:cysteine-rich CWC family protein [Parahaliea mediterranea]|uniref:Cysteine-rich CWC family protein n=1 Tax=Parahaliea mediterranea TaxID=651086 RepID=A0A939DC54_9GAMM|nr:cysteine-rich CWC family protein [Parahaliea mediterranea]